MESPLSVHSRRCSKFYRFSHKDFTSLKGLNFAIEYKNNANDPIRLVGIIGLKDLDIAKKKGNLGY